MIKITNKENSKLLSEYINQDAFNQMHTVNITGCAGYAAFSRELQKLPLDDRNGALTALMTEYELKPFIYSLFAEVGLSQEAKTGTLTNEQLTLTFENLMTEVTRQVFAVTIPKERLNINSEVFAKRLMAIMSMTMNEKNPETILVYNHANGQWRDGQIPISRLIIEVTHFLGENMLDGWRHQVESNIMDILVRKVKYTKPDQFDQRFFPLANVALDSSTGEVVSHSARHLATMGSEVVYQAEAKCPVFENFLSEIFEEKEVVLFIQEFFGYTLYHGHKANALLIGVGAGANGKSTLFDVLQHLVGLKNVSSAPLSNFNTDFGLEPLIGKKLNLATESDADAFKTGKLKALTAGEAISINRKNKPEITMVLPTKLVYLVNQLPLLSDGSQGFERRLLILPFNRTFGPTEQDKNLSKKLLAEIEGILIWSISGLQRLIKQDFNFTTSNAMDKAKEAYVGVGNPVERFVIDRIQSAPGNRITTTEIFTAYKEWMVINVYPFKGTDSRQTFWRLFDEAASKQGIDCCRKKSNSEAFIYDVAFCDEPQN